MTITPNPRSPYATATPDVRHIFAVPVFFPAPKPGGLLPRFYVRLPWNGAPSTWGNGCMVAFLAPSRHAVDAAWRAGMEAGGTDEGQPGPRPHYGPGYYGAYLRDPDGNKLHIVLRADLAGLRRDDIDLTVENNTLTIRGERRRDEQVNEDRYHRLERAYGAFSRSFTLPNTVDPHGVRAEYRDGVLTVTIPLRDEVRPRQIQVEVKE